MTQRDEAIDVLVKFRNCKFNDGKKTNMADCGMNYVLMILGDPNRKFIAKDIAEEMTVSMARMTTMLQKMEDKGYITRTPSNEDKRVSYISLTEEGWKENNRLIESSIRIITRLLNTYGKEKINEIMDILVDIQKIVDEEI